MRLKMRTYYAGPNGSAQPGQAIDVPETEAAALIAGRFAELEVAEERRTVSAADLGLETADMEAPETAALRGGKKGR